MVSAGKNHTQKKNSRRYQLVCVQPNGRPGRAPWHVWGPRSAFARGRLASGETGCSGSRHTRRHSRHHVACIRLRPTLHNAVYPNIYMNAGIRGGKNQGHRRACKQSRGFLEVIIVVARSEAKRIGKCRSCVFVRCIRIQGIQGRA